MDQRKLTECLTRPEHPQRRRLTRDVVHPHREAAPADEVYGVAEIAPVEDHFSPVEPALPRGRDDRRSRLLRQHREKGPLHASE